MKRFIFAVLSSISILIVSCYNEQIDELNSRVDKIEIEKIATIQEQVASISTSILDIQKMNTQLHGYITTLQNQSTELEGSLASVEKKIEDVESELKNYMNAQKVQILATLEEYKRLISEQLSFINTTIADLQVQKVALENQIKSLKDYIDGEIQNTEDWVSVTFATLENFNALATIVTGIQAQIETLNSYLTDIDTTVKAKVAEELTTATAGLRDSMKEEIEAVAKDCTATINSVKEEITVAYETEIKSAIATSESDMKSWVNTLLAKYYTATQIDSKLTSLKNSFETQLESQKTYLMGLIESLEQTLTARIDDNGVAIDELNGNLSALSSEVATVAGNVTSNASAISANAESIKANSKLISDNAKNIEANADDIEVNTQLINANKKLIEDNNALIKANQAEIQTLKNRATAAEDAIAANAEAIADNAADIAANASLIAQNAATISNNGAAIAANAQEIENLKTLLQATEEEITEAYKVAISTAITTLDGKLSGQIATEVATLNSRIDSEAATINAAIEALTARVASCEKDIKSIMTSIYNMQIEISDIQDQIEAILARIQSIEYIPKYSDGKATMYYTNNGKITPGSATFDFELQPAATAEELADVWEDALSMKAVHTQTRVTVDFVDMEIVSVTAEDGVLTVVASGVDLSDDFYLGRISANACLVVSDGNNELASDYINMVPWTTDIIYVPDAAFKAYLVENFDADSDGEISEDEAMDIEVIDLSDVATKIATLAGIEYMKNLMALNAAYHSLTSLDLSHNNALTEVVVNNNKLKTLDLSGCSAIVSLECSGNKLTTLDVSAAVGLTDLVCSNNDLGALNLTNNKALVNLQCSGNELATLNLKNHLALETLYCRSNSLAVLDLSKNIVLKELDCTSNNLTTLNLNKNTELGLVYCRSNSLTSLYLNNCGKITMLDCSKNALTTLNLNGCKSVETLNCSDNSIVTLDLTALKALETLNCSGNDLASLDVSANSALTSVDCSDNASLAKLWVKDAAHQEQMTIKKDAATNIFFNAGGLVFPDKALETYMLANYDDDYDGVISIAEADNVTTVNCANKGISDLTGLESCTNLVYLNCSNNNIKVVDCQTFSNLESLSCYGNPVEVLDLTNCAVLQSLFLQNVSTNAVSGTTINITGYSQSSSLKISVVDTPFATLSVTGSPSLTNLTVAPDNDLKVFNGYDNTSLTSFDVSGFPKLSVLDLHGCALTSLNVDSNPELITLDCSSNQLTKLNVDNNTGLVTLKVNGNNLTQFKVVNNTALETLNVSDNKLSVINVRSNTALKDLRMSNNIDITALNLKNNTALETLYADGLSISEINLVENIQLTYADLSYNLNLTCAYTIYDTSVTGTILPQIDKRLHMINKAKSNDINLIVGDYVIAYGVPGVVYDKNHIIGLKETSANWSSANSWCSSYGDGTWYLPNRDELKVIYNNKSTLNNTLTMCGGATLGTSYYWSSTDYNNYDRKYSVDFSNGSSNGIYKSGAYQVRAVRAL